MLELGWAMGVGRTSFLTSECRDISGQLHRGRPGESGLLRVAQQESGYIHEMADISYPIHLGVTAFHFHVAGA